MRVSEGCTSDIFLSHNLQSRGQANAPEHADKEERQFYQEIDSFMKTDSRENLKRRKVWDKRLILYLKPAGICCDVSR